MYEKVAEEAVQGGLTLSAKYNFPVETEKWSIMQAIFFASTVLTTIGEYRRECPLIIEPLGVIHI
jgi:potassium channel subfamily K protein